MNRTAATITQSIGLMLCLTSLGCIKTSTPGDANSSSASASNERPGSPDVTAGKESAETGDETTGDPISEPTVSAPSNSQNAADEAVVDISFDDIKLPMQEDMVFRPFMLTERVKELDGKRIRISGYMLPDTRTKGIKQFVLLKNTECKFGPGGQADHLLNVLMIEGEIRSFRSEPISIEGRLFVKPFQGPDGNTWSIYDVACERVTRYRPRR